MIRVFVFIITGILIGTISGFVLANQLFKAELNGKSVNYTLEKGLGNSTAFEEVGNQKSEVDKLSKYEVNQALKYAEENKGNVKLQESLGIALYQYSVLEQEPEILNQTVILLERARTNQLNPNSNLLMTLGNIYFEMSQRKFNKNNILLARECYQQIIDYNSSDTKALLNIGLTYFYDRPANYKLAIKSYQRALNVNSSDQIVLENLINASILNQDKLELAKAVKQLEQINPQHPVLNNVQILLAQKELK
jgi:tetratricopeptide (TPR) repeat protein